MKSKGTAYCPVTLEPDLEAEAALLTPAQRLDLARKFERWSRQLRVSAMIMRQRQAVRPRPALRGLPRRQAGLN